MNDIMETKNCLRCGERFRANVMIKGDDVCGTCVRMSSMTFWLPRLQNLNFPVPRTVMVNADVDLEGLVDGVVPRGSQRFFDELGRALDYMGLPAFLRTEMLSNKHDWKWSCLVKDRSELVSYVRNLVEMSHLATIDRRTDYNFFAVRELLETEPVFTHFDGEMPITREMRVFIREGKVQCWHPYWPEEAFKGVDRELIRKVQEFDETDVQTVTGMAHYIAGVFSGYWSIDFLKAKDRGWVCIDMGIGERSWHWRGCEFGSLGV